ncbi:hypothetical protein AX15_007146 [Amanita polypyramis BW_CC]|nr:hypothetical protein AX15_007146 [Amanita polypyramis BW_CC]
MDLCCLIDSEERLSATDLVTMLGDLLERETKFHVKSLPHARIPIVKLSLDPSPGLPYGIACDIGFENRLALENTRLLMCYAMIDPTRVRTLVLFLKVWSKRRKINSPYKGTLSSYGYVLLVIYFLVHVKNPPVLPNLQQVPPLRPISKEETYVNGYNTWFFDDIDLLRQRWRSENIESVGELLIDFFRYYSRDFTYNTGVASIKAGLLKKESKGWQNDLSAGRYNDARERNRFCIEDPFETDYNVARCVTKDGLYTIRGEFMRATRILSGRPERALLCLAELCDERKDDELVPAPLHTAPRLSNPPPQTPFPVGSQSMRANKAPPPDRLSPTAQLTEHANGTSAPQVAEKHFPEHMAPKRGKWTSPPPPEASSTDHTLFEVQLGKGLELATAPTEAREKEPCNSPSSNSETYTDEDRSDAAESDDITSVRSFTEGTNTISGPTPVRRPSWHLQDTAIRIPQINTRDGNGISADLLTSHPPRYAATGGGRNRHARDRLMDFAVAQRLQRDLQVLPSAARLDTMRRQISGSSRGIQGSSSSSSWSPVLTSSSPASTPLPASPDLLSPMDSTGESSTVFYQTTRSPIPTSVLYPTSSSGSPQHSSPQQSAFLSQLHQQHQLQMFYLNNVPRDIFPPNMPPAITSTASSSSGNALDHGVHERHGTMEANQLNNGKDTPTPTLQDQRSHQYKHGHTNTHTHSHSTATVTAPTPPPHHGPATGTAATRFPVQVQCNSPLMGAAEVYSQNTRPSSAQRQPSLSLLSPSPRIGTHSLTQSQMQTTVTQTPIKSSSLNNNKSNHTSPPFTSTISNESSPALSSPRTGYESSTSRSPSPHSPKSPPVTAVPVRRGTGVLSRIGKREGEGEEGGGIFGSFAALEIRDNNRQDPNRRHRLPRHRHYHHHHHRQQQQQQQQQYLHRHHLVTADPAVLEVSPPVHAGPSSLRAPGTAQ